METSPKELAIKNGWRPFSEISKAEDGLYAFLDTTSYRSYTYISMLGGKVCECGSWPEEAIDVEDYFYGGWETMYFSRVKSDNVPHPIGEVCNFISEIVDVVVPLPNGECQRKMYYVNDLWPVPLIFSENDYRGLRWKDIVSLDPTREVVFYGIRPEAEPFLPTENMAKADGLFVLNGDWKPVSLLPADSDKTFAIKTVYDSEDGAHETMQTPVRVADGWVYEIPTDVCCCHDYKVFTSRDYNNLHWYFCEAVPKQD